ncbi:kynureninase [Malassezia vespertilionis]|uniref:Kynureninase n=1 Tax=Malassezia vespertilionis TaxID=2020962 RepID=A0A2N1JGF0_9BASI|nr:kynureninase [Malassezia vespertilionis]PKI85616.1 Bna5p [Malassezia vespertilionis]WFD05428.1 kynureninase [Malassezia vespertilionis]
MHTFSRTAFLDELDGLIPDPNAPHKYKNESLADALTKSDLLGGLRDQYELPRKRDITGNQAIPEDELALYFTGNSLGPLAKLSRHYVAEELDVWSRTGVNGHFSHASGRPWAAQDECVARYAAEMVGAKRSEVAVMATLTQNLHTMLSTFYRPNVPDGIPSPLGHAGTEKRRKIVYEYKAFPSDKYALDSVCLLNGLDPAQVLVPLRPRDGEASLRTEDILAVIDALGRSGEGAMIMLGGVQYFTGQLFEIATIAKAAHAANMLVGLDLAHAFMNVPLQLHDWGIDWAAWCSYKYASAGPGGIAGLFVHERWGKHPIPRPSGWWGHNRATRFTMPETFDPMSGAAGWQVSNPSAIDIAILLGSFETVIEGVKATSSDNALALSGIGSDSDTEEREKLEKLGCGRIMPILRLKSMRLTAYLELLLGPEGFNLESMGVKLCLITPEDPEQRGSQLCIQFLDNASQAEPHKTGSTDQVARFMGKDTLLAKVMELIEKERGVLVDIRYPDVLRMAPLAQFSTYMDVYHACEALAWALGQLQSV